MKNEGEVIKEGRRIGYEKKNEEREIRRNKINKQNINNKSKDKLKKKNEEE